MALSKVPGEEHLYLGGVFSLRRPSGLEAHNITHIISVLRGDLNDIKSIRPGVSWLQIEVDDVEDEDLLQSFNETNDFISKALKEGGGVLVHCAMGKSRSATIIIAYMLATRPDLSPQDALDLLRESRPIAEPNSGFMEQLELFYSMGCPKDVTSQRKYQKWKYDQEVKLSIEAGRAPDVLRFEDEEMPAASASTDYELKCKKCRRTVATSAFVLPHTPPSRPGAGNIQAASNACQHHYVDALSWMKNELSKGELSGRLECPNPRCGTLIGRYAWQGLKCSCGLWVCPAITLQKSRVDEVRKETVGLRMPPGMLRGGAGIVPTMGGLGPASGGSPGGENKGNL